MAERPLIIGHRGASGRLPENTVAAFRGALADGADGIELDVRLSADGLAVVIHDATLARTSGVRGRVSDLTAAELARFDVPTLDDVLALTARPRAAVYVEIKGGGEPLEAAVVADVVRRAARDRVVVLSFNHAALRRVRALDAKIATAASFAPTLRAPKPSPARLVELVERCGATSAALHVSLATRRAVDALARRGFDALVWTVNSPLVARRLGRSGARAVITDHPSRLARAAAEQSR